MYLLQRIREFDVVLSQGMSRGSLNSTMVGWLKGVPVVTYESVAAVEYLALPPGAGADRPGQGHGR